MGCKGFILYFKGAKFENKPFNEQKYIINKLAKVDGHNLNDMLNKIQEISKNDSIKNILQRKLPTSEKHILTGIDYAKILERCYFEMRYPIPSSIVENFPVPAKKGIFLDVTQDSYLKYFVTEVLNELENEIKYIEQTNQVKITPTVSA